MKFRFHTFFRHTNTFIILFWLLFDGGGQEESISVQDQNFTLTTEFGRVFMGAYVICTILVAVNMLIAMMDDSFHKIKVIWKGYWLKGYCLWLTNQRQKLKSWRKTTDENLGVSTITVQASFKS